MTPDEFSDQDRRDIHDACLIAVETELTSAAPAYRARLVGLIGRLAPTQQERKP